MTATSIREATITTIQQSALRWQRQRGWRATKSAMAARAMARMKRVAGERWRRHRRGRWRRQRGRQVTKRAMVKAARVMATPTKRAMVAATRAAGDAEGDGEGGESDGDAYEEGDGGGDEGGRRQRGRWRSFGVSSAAASASAAAPRRRVGPWRRRRRPIRINDNDTPRQHSRGLFFCLVRCLPRHIEDDECRGAPVVRNRPDGQRFRVRQRLHYLMR
jgi:hypothetical protein